MLEIQLEQKRQLLICAKQLIELIIKIQDWQFSDDVLRAVDDADTDRLQKLSDKLSRS